MDIKEEIKNNFIDIQPPTSIYSTYSRLTYTLWHAIAEFVDNSTASYFLNKEKIQTNYENNYILKIYITYYKDSFNKKNNYLEITDNAYGMEFNDFRRAIQLNAKPENTNYRNEFGMGLKTAACWFGKNWEIKTTQLNSKNEYSLNFDLNYLEKSNNKEISFNVKEVDCKSHYTQIKISDLNRYVRTSRQRKKIIEQISSMYRCDLREKNIEIRYVEKHQLKDKTIKFEDGKNEYKNLEEVPSLSYEKPKIRIDDKNEQEYFQAIQETIEYENFKYKINGFVAILDTGSRENAGFTLIRRGRVIESNYRPKDIFGDAGTYVYQRLFGEIHMDSWPVMQAKNCFDWDYGLEDVFIDKMIDLSKEYKKIANAPLKKEKVQNNVHFDFNQIKDNNKSISLMLDIKNNDEVMNNPNFKNILSKVEYEENNSELNSNVISLKNEMGEEITMVFEDSFDDSEKWIDISIINEKDNIYKICMYLEHPFFKPYSLQQDFLFLLKKFVAALSAAILNIRYVQKQSEISPINIIEIMNSYLKNANETEN